MAQPVYLAVVMEAPVVAAAMVGQVDTEVLEEFQAVEVAAGQEMTVLAMLAMVDLGEEVK
jgi:type III secretion system FlhB-like substrate exporter|tara:strand:+ start:2450 stop:2629 length:180 start_codon:yes stop_codon:yes gene_type:complete